jgi:hypothetical protein
MQDFVKNFLVLELKRFKKIQGQWISSSGNEHRQFGRPLSTAGFHRSHAPAPERQTTTLRLLFLHYPSTLDPNQPRLTRMAAALDVCRTSPYKEQAPACDIREDGSINMAAAIDTPCPNHPDLGLTQHQTEV